jgi:hypothetical protein
MEDSQLPEIFKEDIDLELLGEIMKEVDDGSVQCELQHDFSDGIYIRTIKIPKGTLILGKRHRFETLNILLKGEISIYMGGNHLAKRMKAPCIFTSGPNVKKLVYAHTDVLFSNIHSTVETDVDRIEEIFIIPEKEYLQHKGKKCLGQL